MPSIQDLPLPAYLPKSTKALTRESVKQTHKEFNNNTAGCGPAHRCAPLAGFMNIPNNQLISLARTEAKITHYHEDAGNGSAVVVMLYRYLLEGYNLKQAEILIAKDPELRSTWEKIAQADLKRIYF